MKHSNVQPVALITSSWLRPRITIAACIEVAVRWWAVMLLGMILLSALLLSLQQTQVEALREARLEIGLQGLRDRMETNLALGFELADSEQAQALLEDLLTDDPSLLAAEVFDSSAVSLFNTDRGAIGEQVPGDWLAASASSARPLPGKAQGSRAKAWTAHGIDSVTLGLPIHGPFGEIAGHVAITSTSPTAPTPWLLVTGLASVVVLFTLLSAVLTIWLLRALGRQQDHAGMSRAEARIRHAESRLERALAELKRNEDIV